MKRSGHKPLIDDPFRFPESQFHIIETYAAVAMEVVACPPELIGDAATATWERGAPQPREVRVHFRDDAAGDVRIAGDFNGWVPDKDVRSRVEAEGPHRVWTKVLLLPPGTYQYRYVVDGEWRTDPSNPESTPGPMGQPNSVLHVR